MEQKNLLPHFHPIHRVGMRTVKTVIAATLVAIAYGLLDRNACFACIGAVYGMGGMVRDGLRSGGNRFLGTLIGGLLAIPFYWLTNVAPIPLPDWLLLGLGLFLILYISGMFEANGAIQPGTVVFFVVLYTVTPERYISYTLARILDTGIGVWVALTINWLFPSPLDKQSRAEKARLAAETAEQAAHAAEQAALAAEHAANAAELAVAQDSTEAVLEAKQAAEEAERLAEAAEVLAEEAEELAEEADLPAADLPPKPTPNSNKD